MGVCFEVTTCSRVIVSFLYFSDLRSRICPTSWSFYAGFLECDGHNGGDLCAYFVLPYNCVSKLQKLKLEIIPKLSCWLHKTKYHAGLRECNYQGTIRCLVQQMHENQHLCFISKIKGGCISISRCMSIDRESKSKVYPKCASKPSIMVSCEIKQCLTMYNIVLY